MHRSIVNQDLSEYAAHYLEMCTVSVSALLHHLQSTTPIDETAVRVGVQYSAHLSELLECLRRMLHEWQDYLNHYQLRGATSFHASLTHSESRPGRPRFNVSREQLQYLHSMSITWVQISKILDVSYMTIYRWRQEYGMMENPGRNITDRELHEVLRQVRQELPALGETIVWGRLRSVGFRITGARVPKTMRMSDPLHTALRWREITPCMSTTFSTGTQFLVSYWYVIILSRFKAALIYVTKCSFHLIQMAIASSFTGSCIVTHCAIDGYSRLIVFLKCSSNWASTVYNLFLQAVRQYGLPSRIR